MKALITGGVGFVGSNYAWHLLEEGWDVVVLDNFSRGEGNEKNAKWLKSHANAEKHLTIVCKDIDRLVNPRLLKNCDLIVHAAAQVSVPRSIEDPWRDFFTNVFATFCLLETIRRSEEDPVIIYTSSNKVYGTPNVRLQELPTRYDFEGIPGIDESWVLKPEEPYGASKATGDLYMQVYHKRYGFKTVIFRCSCMYGPRQWGKEEQGWVAWFCIAAAKDLPITIFGDGKQARDVLYIDDVVDAFDLARINIDKAKGEAINLGGGPGNALSLLDVIDYLQELSNRHMNFSFAPWRPGDNKCYITNNEKARRLLNWTPNIAWPHGILDTYDWAKENVP